MMRIKRGADYPGFVRHRLQVLLQKLLCAQPCLMYFPALSALPAGWTGDIFGLLLPRFNSHK
jgi:hypothetical protein